MYNRFNIYYIIIFVGFLQRTAQCPEVAHGFSAVKDKDLCNYLTQSQLHTFTAYVHTSTLHYYLCFLFYWWLEILGIIVIFLQRYLLTVNVIIFFATDNGLYIRVRSTVCVCYFWHINVWGDNAVNFPSFDDYFTHEAIMIILVNTAV